MNILIYFGLTVKAATLIFIFGRGSAISSAKEGKSGFIYKKTCVHFMKVLTVYTLTSHVLTRKAHITKSRMCLLPAETF